MRSLTIKERQVKIGAFRFVWPRSVINYSALTPSPVITVADCSARNFPKRTSTRMAVENAPSNLGKRTLILPNHLIIRTRTFRNLNFLRICPNGLIKSHSAFASVIRHGTGLNLDVNWWNLEFKITKVETNHTVEGLRKGGSPWTSQPEREVNLMQGLVWSCTARNAVISSS